MYHSIDYIYLFQFLLFTRLFLGLLIILTNANRVARYIYSRKVKHFSRGDRQS